MVQSKGGKDLPHQLKYHAFLGLYLGTTHTLVSVSLIGFLGRRVLRLANLWARHLASKFDRTPILYCEGASSSTVYIHRGP